MGVKAAYWMEGGILAADKINANLFTHLFCAFADIDRSTFAVVADRVSNQVKVAAFTHFNQVVHQNNPGIKTVLSIGGAEGDGLLQAFATMAKSHATRAVFIDSSIQMARQCGFDGLDLDYEIPETPDDMKNLSTLLYEWRAAVNKESGPSRPALLLTAAVRYTSTNYDGNPYPAQSMAGNLDWINVMSYDYTTSARVSWGSPDKTALTSVLYGDKSGSNGVRDWINAGVPINKIVFGIPFYGYGWKLVNPQNHGIGAAANGPYNDSDGAMPYRDIPKGILTYNPEHVESYSYQGLTWVSYNDPQTVAAKVVYARQNGLLGYFAWQLAHDDTNFTLSRAAAEA